MRRIFEITGAEVCRSKELSGCGLYVIARVLDLDIKNIILLLMKLTELICRKYLEN